MLLISSVMLKGFSLNFLIVNVLPLGEISSLKVAASLCFPKIMASRIGKADETCFSDLCASWIMNSSNASLSVKTTLVGMLS